MAEDLLTPAHNLLCSRKAAAVVATDFTLTVVPITTSAVAAAAVVAGTAAADSHRPFICSNVSARVGMRLPAPQGKRKSKIVWHSGCVSWLREGGLEPTSNVSPLGIALYMHCTVPTSKYVFPETQLQHLAFKFCFHVSGKKKHN